jgi:hypothetical protein
MTTLSEASRAMMMNRVDFLGLCGHMFVSSVYTTAVAYSYTHTPSPSPPTANSSQLTAHSSQLTAVAVGSCAVRRVSAEAAGCLCFGSGSAVSCVCFRLDPGFTAKPRGCYYLYITTQGSFRKWRLVGEVHAAIRN